MLVNPRVCRRKFDREVERVLKQLDALAGRGAYLISAEFPNVDLLFTPKLPLHVSFPIPSALVGVRTPIGNGVAQMLSARPFVVRFGLDDFDVEPPSLVFLDPTTMTPLAKEALPRGFIRNEQGAVQPVLLDDHALYKRSFLCLRGTREYHHHAQHTGDDWFLYRRYMGLLHAIDLVLRTMLDHTHARLLFLGNSVQVRWELEGPR